MDTFLPYIRLIPPFLPIALVSLAVMLGSVAYMILAERKIAAWTQDRVGPNRTGLGFGIIPFLKDFHFWGLGQPMADGLKFFLKEDYKPKGVDTFLFTLAPIILMTVIMIAAAVIPWGGIIQSTHTADISAAVASSQTSLQAAESLVPWWATMHGEPSFTNSGTTATVNYRWAFQVANLNIGVLFVLAALSLAVYGVVLGGWASNNKYSFLGGMRATANMISYEIPLGACVLCIVLLVGSLDLGVIVEKQAHSWFGILPAWNIFTQPIAFILFLVCIHAEANRAPFDIAEAEQELVGGYHTEYSSMRFALFFLAEYMGMIATSALCVALFFGGWHLPGLTGTVDPTNPAVTTSIFEAILRSGVFFAKTLGIIFIFMWVRWSLPRFRFDQIMLLAWRTMIPLSLLLLIGTTLVIYFWADAPRPLGQVPPLMALMLAGANIAAFVLVMLVAPLIPETQPVNRRLNVPGSRFTKTPLPSWAK
jgi:NADH-quinone oxidoreductase subunit H